MDDEKSAVLICTCGKQIQLGFDFLEAQVKKMGLVSSVTVHDLVCQEEGLEKIAELLKANDGTADSNTATVNIAVNDVNDVPVADSQSVSTDEDTDEAVTLAATDADGDSLTYSLIVNPAGIVFGSGSTVNVAQLVASGLNMSDQAFQDVLDSPTNDIAKGCPTGNKKRYNLSESQKNEGNKPEWKNY